MEDSGTLATNARAAVAHRKTERVEANIVVQLEERASTTRAEELRLAEKALKWALYISQARASKKHSELVSSCH